MLNEKLNYIYIYTQRIKIDVFEDTLNVNQASSSGHTSSEYQTAERKLNNLNETERGLKLLNTVLPLIIFAFQLESCT